MPKKIKKVSPYKKLQGELTTCRELNDMLRQDVAYKRMEVERLQRECQKKIDDSMIRERRLLAESLAKLVDATTHAIGYVVAKEVL